LTLERVSKRMARAGLCSRRDAEKLILEGKVLVNGKIHMELGQKVEDSDEISVQGKVITATEQTQKPRLFLYHKPPGLLTTHRDTDGRATVFEAIQRDFPDLPRLISVGRLDLMSEGLLLLTNNGNLSRTLEHPKNAWKRCYRVRIYGTLSEQEMRLLQQGLTVDGVHYDAIGVTLEKATGANTWVALTLQEGKNREIRRIMEHFDHPINKLIRMSYGPFQLGHLPPGGVTEVAPKILRTQLPGF